MADTHTRRYLQALLVPAGLATPLTAPAAAASASPASSSLKNEKSAGQAAVQSDGGSSSVGVTAASDESRSDIAGSSRSDGRDIATGGSGSGSTNNDTLSQERAMDATVNAADIEARISKVVDLLKDTDIPEEDKPDALKSLLAQVVVGTLSSNIDLDAAVLGLLHRHREDVQPTGQTFSPSQLPKQPGTLSRSSSFRRNLTPTSASSLVMKRAATMTPTRPISPSPLRAQSPSLYHQQRVKESEHISHAHSHIQDSSASSTAGSSAPSSPFGSPRFLNATATSFKPSAAAAEFKPSLGGPATPSAIPASSRMALQLPESRMERLRSISPIGTPVTESPTLWAFNSSPLGTPKFVAASPAYSGQNGSYFPGSTTVQSSTSRPIPSDPWTSASDTLTAPTSTTPGFSHSASTASSESSHEEAAFDPFAEQQQLSTGKNQILSDEDEDEWGIPSDPYGASLRRDSETSPSSSHPSLRIIPDDDDDDDDDLQILNFKNGQLVPDDLRIIEPPSNERPVFDEQYIPQSTSQYSQLPQPMASPGLLTPSTSVFTESSSPTGLGASSSNYIMTPFDVLCSIFAGSDVSPADLEEALNVNGWDVDRSMEWIINNPRIHPTPSTSQLNEPYDGAGRSLSMLDISDPMQRSMSGSSPPSRARTPNIGHAGSGSRPLVVSRESFNRQYASRGGARGGHGDHRPRTPGGRSDYGNTSADSAYNERGSPSTRLCKYFMQGNCLRSDCRFSHDLGKAVCKFWLRGHCLKGEGRCEFLHSVPPHLAQDVAQLRMKALQDRDREKARLLGRGGDDEDDASSRAEEDFPSLAAASASLQARSSAVKDPATSRWAGIVKSGRPITPTVPVNSRPSLPRSPSGSSLRGGLPRERSAPYSQPRQSARLALRPPRLLPTITTGAAVAKLYEQYRDSFFEYGNARNKCLVKASHCWKSGDGAGARRWSSEAQDWNKQIARAGSSAARNIVRERKYALREAVMSNGMRPGSVDESADRQYRGQECGAGLGVCLGVAAASEALGPEATRLSASERTEVALDLHGLHADEALDLLEKFLLGIAGENTMRGLAYVVVGQERHTGTADPARGSRKVRLADAVGTWLDSFNYAFWLTNGIYAIDPY